MIEASIRLPRFFPLFMTAAGTVPPASVLVLGAGVAGLQAIATAKRLGAKVSAYDVRPASADEVRSMGGTFVELDLESVEGTGGYAREMSEDRAARQRELLAPYVAAADVLITTAAIPGRAAPRLVTTRDGGGDEAGLGGRRPRRRVGRQRRGLGARARTWLSPSARSRAPGPHGNVTLVGMKDGACTMPVDASRLYAKNVVNLLLLMTSEGQVVPDFDDEVVAGTVPHPRRLGPARADR